MGTVPLYISDYLRAIFKVGPPYGNSASRLPEQKSPWQRRQLFVNYIPSGGESSKALTNFKLSIKLTKLTCRHLAIGASRRPSGCALDGSRWFVPGRRMEEKAQWQTPRWFRGCRLNGGGCRRRQNLKRVADPSEGAHRTGKPAVQGPVGGSQPGGYLSLRRCNILGVRAPLPARYSRICRRGPVSL